MFYRISYEKQNDVSKFFDILRDKGKLVYVNGVLYLNSETSKQHLIELLFGKIPKEVQFMVIEIDDSNIKQQPDIIQHKIHEENIRLEKEQFELKEQEALKEYNAFIDRVKANLESQLKNKNKKRGGNNSAQLRNKKQENTSTKAV